MIITVLSTFLATWLFWFRWYYYPYSLQSKLAFWKKIFFRYLDWDFYRLYALSVTL